MRPLDQIHSLEEMREVARAALASSELLHRDLAALKKRLAALEQSEAAQLLSRLQKLEEQARKQAIPGGKSEKRGTSPKKPKAQQVGHGPREQPELPVIEEVHRLDEADQVCPCCGKPLTEWEGQFEQSEMIDVHVREHVRKIHKRQKYRCGCGHIQTALGPKKLIENGRYSTEFAIQVVANKFLDHVPLERQSRIMRREGLKVSSQTLWDQEWALYTVLSPVLSRMLKHQATQPVRHGDETRWPILNHEAHNWTMWCDVSAELVIFRILDGRSQDEGAQLFGNVNGVLMVDGYGVYTALAKTYPSLNLAHCWAHARRKFIEIENAFPVESELFTSLIGKLFHIDAAGPPEDRGRRRSEESHAIISEIQQRLLQTPALPGSSLRSGMDYVAKRWTGLTRFLDDATIPLDNNLAERSLRGPVNGRKNRYGSKSRRGTEAAALFYSLFESAKLVGLEPVAYLRLATDAALDGHEIPLPHEVARN